MNEPICMTCANRMAVKLRIAGQANLLNQGKLVRGIGPVVQEIENSACKLAMIPVTENPCVLECSEYTPTESKPVLFRPVAEEAKV